MLANFLTTDLTTMDYVYKIIMLLGGVGAFLLGFKILSENMEKLANKSLRKILEKATKNRFVGVVIGMLVTAIIQSSSATTVMVVGFVNAGIMNLFQATAMIMGANIGTTITAQIVALKSFDIATFAIGLVFIGVFMDMLSKREKTKTFGLTIAGLGLVFLALEFMSDSMSFFKELPAVSDLLMSVDNPFLLLLIGIFLTALIQSSSAVATIIISMVAAGLQIGSTPNAVLFLILGTNIGTCVTALLSSVGATPNARRASIIHLLFNVCGTLIFVVILLIWKDFAVDVLHKAFPEPTTQIAMFHTIFNVISTLIFIPFINLFIKAASLIVKDKKKSTRASYLDERFLNTPSVAVLQATREVAYLGQESMRALDLALEGLLKRDLEYKTKVFEIIDNVEECNKNILTYLVKISSKEVSLHDEKKISNLYSIINDFIREAEIADNVVKHTRTMAEKEITFSDEVVQSLYEIKDLLARQFENVERVMIKKDHSVLNNVDKIEDRIDTMRIDLTNGHIKRLEEGKCQPHSSGVFINLISNLERAGDHLNYIVDLLTTK